MAESVDKVLLQDNVQSTLSSELVWDPFLHADNIPTPQCLKRIKRLVKEKLIVFC